MNQPPHGQPPGYPQHGQPPYQGQPMAPPPYGYPPQSPPAQPQPLQVRQVGRSVTKPAWTIGDITWMVFTGGLAWPWIWARHRRRTTITRHY